MMKQIQKECVMNKDRPADIEVVAQSQSPTSSMNTVVTLAQQRDAMLGLRLGEIASIERDLEAWRENQLLHTFNSTSLK